MSCARCFILAAVLCVGMVGCGQSKYTGAKRFPLTGTVKVDGTLIDYGTISFIPTNGKDQRVSGGPIKDGAYAVSEEDGANSGKYRVEIRWHKATGQKVPDSLGNGEMNDVRVEGLPDRFHKNSELTADVSEDHKVFDFDLKSK